MTVHDYRTYNSSAFVLFRSVKTVYNLHSISFYQISELLFLWKVKIMFSILIFSGVDRQ